MVALSPPPDAAPGQRPVLSTRRSSQGGVAMSSETRPPRELLKKIGISGKEVVKIIKDRLWDIVEPHGLQQQKLYYLPGVLSEKGAEAVQSEDFFVGEGELYAFILKQGGLRYLLPDEDFSDESEVEATQVAQEKEEDAQEESSAEETAGGAGSEQRKWKRRKKLSTARSKSAGKTVDKTVDKSVDKTAKRRRKAVKLNSANGGIAEDEEEDEQDQIRVTPRVKMEQQMYGGIGQQTEFSEYEGSLTSRGWRAQLLQDVDVHLLRSVAAVDRRQRALEALVEEKKRSARPAEGVGPHVQDTAEILHELEGLKCSIRASLDDLSAMLEGTIVQGERVTIPDRIDPVGRIGIPGFVSTGPGSLVLVRDIERYLLLVVAAVRRYQRARRTMCINGSSHPTGQAVRRADLRALQLGIEESKRELQELATIIVTEASRSCQEGVQDATQSTSQSTSQGTSQSSAGITDCDTDHGQSSGQQSVASPQILEGGK